MHKISIFQESIVVGDVESKGECISFDLPGDASESEILARPNRDRKKPSWFSDYVVNSQYAKSCQSSFICIIVLFLQIALTKTTILLLTNSI